MNLPPPSACGNVAIVGGGRWARVVASILLDISAGPSQLVLCSPRHPEGWTEWIAARTAGEREILAETNTIGEVLANRSIGTVFVIRSAHDHAETAIAALAAGKDTFIEKPFAMTLSDAERVVTAAANQRCSVGHVLLFAPNLRRFAEAVQSLGAPQKIAIQWSDPSREQRHGEAKNFDHSVNITNDVFPHIWSLAKLFAPNHTVELNDVGLEYGGRAAALQMTAGAASIDVRMERESQSRQRRIFIQTARGGAEIDFSVEPGTANILGQPVDVSTGYSSPLRRELENFLQIAPDLFASSLCNVSRAIEPVRLLEPFRERIGTQRLNAIRRGAAPNATFQDQEAAHYALRETIAGDLRRNSRLQSQMGLAHHDDIARKVLLWCRGRNDADEPPMDFSDFRWISVFKPQS